MVLSKNNFHWNTGLKIRTVFNELEVWENGLLKKYQVNLKIEVEVEESLKESLGEDVLICNKLC